MVARRLSQAISEGDGISLIVEVDGPEAARGAEERGADAVLARELVADVRAATSLPVLAFGPGADGCIVAADGAAAADGEVVVRVEREAELDEALARHDPELLVLAGSGDDDDPLVHLLSLLSAVPAGKLAIAELGAVSQEQLDALERAGVDAVLVRGATPDA